MNINIEIGDTVVCCEPFTTNGGYRFHIFDKAKVVNIYRHPIVIGVSADEQTYWVGADKFNKYFRLYDELTFKPVASPDRVGIMDEFIKRDEFEIL